MSHYSWGISEQPPCYFCGPLACGPAGTTLVTPALNDHWLSTHLRFTQENIALRNDKVFYVCNYVIHLEGTSESGERRSIQKCVLVFDKDDWSRYYQYVFVFNAYICTF